MEKDIQIDFMAKAEKVEPTTDSRAISFSSKLIEVLEAKVKTHNLASQNKVSTQQLKKVYVRGASDEEEGKTFGLCAMARVNMFLRMVSGAVSKNRNNKSKERFMKMADLDMTENWAPSDEDFALAGQEIQSSALDYDFKDVNELYLDSKDDKSSRFWFDF